MTKRTLLSISLVTVLVLAATGSAQAQVTYDPNREQFQLLSLNQSYIQLGQSAKSFIRAREQYEDGFISTEQYDQALAAYRRAKIDYDMALMRMLYNASTVIVERAVKRVQPDGSKIVEVTVRNEAGGSFELTKLRTFGARETEMVGGSSSSQDDGDFSVEGSSDNEDQDYKAAIDATLPFLEGQGLAFDDVINLLEVNNVFISLSARSTDTNDVVMISQPYERKIDRLEQNERVTLRFGLLRDVENCNINLRYGDKTETKPVYLELATTEGGVRMESQNPSLQADLDGEASFRLSLERFTSETTFALRVANLPSQIEAEFRDPDNNNQPIAIVNFTEGAVRKTVNLNLDMPTRDSEEVQVDQEIHFDALIMDQSVARRFDELAREHGRNIPSEELNELNAGVVDLTVTPMGVGEIEIAANNLYYEIQPDQTAEMTLTVKNSGTGDLKNIEIDANLPNNEWTAQIEPALIRELLPEEEAKVQLVFTPPTDATVGEHMIKVEVQGKTRNRIIEASDQQVTVKLEEKPDIWGRVILIVVLIGIVLGIVVFGIKLSRR